MTPAVLVAIIAAVASVAGTAAVGWFTYRSARQSTQATKELEKDKLSTTSWEAQVKNWRDDVVMLRAQRAEDKREYEATIDRMCAEGKAKDAKIAALEEAEEQRDRVVHELRAQVRALTERLSRYEDGDALHV